MQNHETEAMPDFIFFLMDLDIMLQLSLEFNAEYIDMSHSMPGAAQVAQCGTLRTCLSNINLVALCCSRNSMKPDQRISPDTENQVIPGEMTSWGKGKACLS